MHIASTFFLIPFYIYILKGCSSFQKNGLFLFTGITNFAIFLKKANSFCFLIESTYICIVVYAIIV